MTVFATGGSPSATAQPRNRATVWQSFLSAVVALAPGGEFSATSGAFIFPSAASPVVKAPPLAAGAPPPAVKETPLAVSATPPAANQTPLSKRGASPAAGETPLAADQTPLFTGDTPISRKTGHFDLN